MGSLLLTHNYSIMSEEQKSSKILEAVVSIQATQEQVLDRLEAIEKRLSSIEIKIDAVWSFFEDRKVREDQRLRKVARYTMTLGRF